MTTVRATCEEAISRLIAGDVRAAESLVLPALAVHPRDPNLLYVAGNCALARGDDSTALAYYERALALAADFPAVLLNVGHIHRRNHRLDEARRALRRCTELTPLNAAAWVNLVATFVNEGEPTAGEEVAREALVLCPRSAELRWNLGLILLEQGRWEEGWREYRHRFETPVMRRPRFGTSSTPPVLAALDDLRPGHTVVCHGEQGLGDEILFAGMLHELAAAVGQRHATLILDCNPRLRTIFDRTFRLPSLERDRTGSLLGRIPDWTLPIGDLGGFFRLHQSDFPDRSRYLEVVSDRIAEVRRRLAPPERPTIGIAWTGGTERSHARYRQIPLREWLPILKHNATFVSLEYRDCSAEVSTLAKTDGIAVSRIPELAMARDYDDVAHLVAALDLVITVPTSVLHAAGAVGTRCWVMMHQRAAWRECSSNDRLPWYPRTHRRFVRQSADASWDATIDDVAGELQRFLSGSAVPDSRW